jgi:hypothetical protein
VVLAGRPLWAWPAALLVGSPLSRVLAGRLGVAAAVGGPLLRPDLLDGGTSSLAVGPLAWAVGLEAKGPLRVGDLVGAPVVLDLGSGVAPGPLAPGRLSHRPERLQDTAGAVGFDRQAGGAPLPGQGRTTCR